jgi:hypothetical protein
MLTFSSDSMAHEAEMQAIIWYLTGIAYLDGHFDQTERQYLRDQMVSLVEQRARALVGNDLTAHQEAIDRWILHFHETVDLVAAEVGGYFTESPAEGEDITQFVTARLKLRCFELLKGFDEGGQRQLMAVADELILADGVVHPAEKAFRDDLEHLLHEPDVLDDTLVTHLDEGSVVVERASSLAVRLDDHPFLRALERDWSRDPDRFAEEAESDLRLIRSFMARLDEKRAAGNGRLAGKKEVGEFAPGDSFLDGHVHVYRAPENTDVELLVVGDLHGCYSCLKAALLQTDFFTKVEAHHLDPVKNPAMKLVLLGDYIDRGRFSFNGVLRAAIRLALVAPDDVYVLRGNHEYYIEHNGKVLAPVRPAEAMQGIQDIATQEVFASYMRLFEALPTSLLFERTMFVHAGIPRDATLKEKWKDLSSLNDPDIRFQMLWSDPSTADHVPDDLQAANARFGYGKKQFQRFMAGAGLRAMVRGHEKINEGFRVMYDDPQAQLMTVFSSGGKNNGDLPAQSGYRSVTPMALTMRHHAGVTEVVPFELDYGRFNDPKYNAFFESPIIPST